LSPGKQSSVRVALLCILALAAWLRLDGIGFGLDLSTPENALFTNDVDARGMALEVRELLLHGDFDPGNFLYRGPAAFYLFGLVDAAVLALQAPFHPGGWSGVLAELRQNPSLLHLVHRCISALAGVLTVALVFRIVRRDFGATAGLLSALLMAVAYLHVRDSHFGTVDVLSGFVSLAAIEQMLLLLRDPRRARYLSSGLLAGASTATKYFGSVLGLLLVLAHFLARGRARENGARAPGGSLLALALLACPLGFFLCSPSVVPALGNLVEHVLFNVDKLKPRIGSASPWNTLLYHARYTLACGLGEPALLLALLGVWPLWRAGRTGRFLLAGSLLLASALVATRLESSRYGIPFLVTLPIPAGILLARMTARLPWALAALLGGLVVAPSVARSCALDRVLNGSDTRLEMLALLRERGQPEEDVLAVGLALDLPVLEKNERLFHMYSSRAGRVELDELRAHPPRTILLSLTTPHHEIREWPALEGLLAARYREVRRLDVGDDPVGLFEPDGGTRALRVAYASPWRQTRPGPALALYELTDGGTTDPGDPPRSRDK
jgi:hypothetical protein